MRISDWSSDVCSSDLSPILYVKVQSGRQIEEARKKRRLTQRDLARELGMGVRWLREIEGGNPRSRLDDHLVCAYRLGLSTRSEERCGGNEGVSTCRARWSAENEKKKTIRVNSQERNERGQDTH